MDQSLYLYKMQLRKFTFNRKNALFNKKNGVLIEIFKITFNSNIPYVKIKPF